MGLKAELLERANILENDSRGWFEDDDELEARLKEVRYPSTYPAAHRGSSYSLEDMTQVVRDQMLEKAGLIFVYTYSFLFFCWGGGVQTRLALWV